MLLAAAQACHGFPPCESSFIWMHEQGGEMRMEGAVNPVLTKCKHVPLGVFILLV